MSDQSSNTDHLLDNTYQEDLYGGLASLQTADEVKAFLEDLCTPAELRSMADRWRVARLLASGHSYRTINDKTGVSTTTITRVARSMTYGTKGYRILLDRQQGN